MKKHFTLLLFFWIFTGIAAAPKIALTGHGERGHRLADQVLVELSDDYELVERQAIDSIQKEINLNSVFAGENLAKKSRLVGADIFVVIGPYNQKSLSLTIFESECGFRLKQVLLPGDNTAAVQEIKKALAENISRVKRSEKIPFISLVGVRNNLHYSMQETAERMTDELMRRLIASEAVILERDYLIELLREERLTGKWEKAVTASEILHFELNPGREGRRFVITAYLSDPADQIVFRSECEDGDFGGLNRMFEEIDAHLKQSRNHENFNRQTEAARFDREAATATKLNDNIGAFKKYFAAFALDNRNTKYLVKMYPHPEKVSELYPFVKTVLEYLAATPSLLKQHRYMQYANSLLECIWVNRFQLSPEQKKTHLDFLNSKREIFLNAFHENDLAEYPIGRAIERFRNLKTYYYFDRREALEAKLVAWENVMTYLAGKRLDNMSERTWRELLVGRFYRIVVEELLVLQNELPRKKMADWDETVARRLEEMEQSELRPLAALLRANQLLYDRGYTLERAVFLFDAFFQAKAENGLAGEIFYYYPKVAKYPGLLAKIQALEQKYRNQLITEKKMVKASSLTDDRNQLEFYRQTPELFRRDPEKIKKLAEFNPQWQITKLWPAGDELREILVSSISDDLQNIYFLTYDQFDYKVMQLTADGQIMELAAFPLLRNSIPGGRYRWNLHVDQDYIAVSCWNLLFIGKRGSGNLVEIGQISFAINSIFVKNDRIFILGDRELMSFEVSGRNRQIHFSASQEEKILSLQKKFPELTAFYAGSGKQENEVIILFCGGRISGLWRYDLTDGNLTQLVSLPGYCDSRNWSEVIKIQDILFLQVGMYPGNQFSIFYQYELADNRLTMLACKETPGMSQFVGRRSSTAEVLALPRNQLIGGAFMRSGDTLLISGIRLPRNEPDQRNYTRGSARVLELKEHSKFPNLNFPVVNGLYPYPDVKHLIAVEYFQISRITCR